MRPASSIVISATLALCACGGGDPPIDQPPPKMAGALTLGAGDTFAPYAEGADVDLVSGAQGGFHVWVRYQFDGPVGGAAKLERTAHRVEDGAIVLRTSGEVMVEDLSPPLPMFMCPSPIGLSVIDRPISFRLRLLGDDGAAIAEQAVTLVPHCPVEDQHDFCLRICTG